MFNPFKWLDGTLLGTAQKLCDKIQRLTGLTKFAIEKWTLIVMTAFFGTYTVTNSSTINILLIVTLTMLVVYVVHYIERAEVRFLKDGDLEYPIFNAPMRLSWLCINGFLAYISFISDDYAEIILACGYICYILFCYLDECVPRPPSKSKAREWCDKLLTALNNWAKPAPAPTPS